MFFANTYYLAIEGAFMLRATEEGQLPSTAKRAAHGTAPLGEVVQLVEDIRPPVMEIAVREVDLTKVTPEAWDREARLAGGSRRSAHAHLASDRIRSLYRRRLAVFELTVDLDGQVERIGHYILVRERGRTCFFDGICLKPEYGHLWNQVITSALAQSGPGAYEYGWDWSLEPPREEQLALIPGATVTDVRPNLVQAIEFDKWDSWDAYYRSVSNNARRNAKSALTQFPDLKITVRTGFASLTLIPALAGLRSVMYRRKSINSFRPIRTALGYLAQFVTMPGQALVASVSGNRRTLAAYRFIEFGDLSYYTDGAAATAPGGAAWHLMLDMLKRQYHRAPKGKVLLGYIDNPPAPDFPEGLMRSRQSMRASDWPTSVVAFDWEPTKVLPLRQLRNQSGAVLTASKQAG